MRIIHTLGWREKRTGGDMVKDKDNWRHDERYGQLDKDKHNVLRQLET